MYGSQWKSMEVGHPTWTMGLPLFVQPCTHIVLRYVLVLAPLLMLQHTLRRFKHIKVRTGTRNMRGGLLPMTPKS